MKQSADDAETLKDLSDLCFQVLRADPSPGRVAIPFLHFLSAHPKNLTRYQALLDGKSPTTRNVRNTLGRMRLAAKSWFAGNHLWEGDPLPSSADILFVSHFLRPEQAATGEDLYFGALPQYLAQKGINPVVALIDHSETSWHQLRENWSSNAIPRILLRDVTGSRAERRSRRLMNAAAAALRAEEKMEADADKRLFLRHAATDAGSAASRVALRIGDQVGELVSRLQPNLIVTTFEGHGWERLAFRSARAAKPEIKCAGYHHAVLFPLQDALTRRLGRGFDPDAIMTAGNITRDHLSSLPALRDIPIAVLGSPRGIQSSKPTESPNQGERCLLLPEGIESESLLLSRLAIALAKQRTQQQFTIRLHPLLTPEKLIAHDDALRSLPNNVNWSNGTLEADLQASRWVIYRGSSAVIAAVGAGLKPIYFSRESSELSVDPLQTMAGWREICSTPEMVIENMNIDLRQSNEHRAEKWKRAREFCNQYFRPFDSEEIINIMNL